MRHKHTLRHLELAKIDLDDTFHISESNGTVIRAPEEPSIWPIFFGGLRDAVSSGDLKLISIDLHGHFSSGFDPLSLGWQQWRTVNLSDESRLGARISKWILAGNGSVNNCPLIDDEKVYIYDSYYHDDNWLTEDGVDGDIDMNEEWMIEDEVDGDSDIDMNEDYSE